MVRLLVPVPVRMWRRHLPIVRVPAMFVMRGVVLMFQSLMLMVVARCQVQP